MTYSIAEIQSRVNALSNKMIAKGQRAAEASFHVVSNAEFEIWLSWHEKKDLYRDGLKTFRGSSIDEAFQKAEAHVASLPSPEEANLRRFMAAVGNAIDIGKETGMEVTFLNPLTETMKTLSKNALTYDKARDLQVAS